MAQTKATLSQADMPARRVRTLAVLLMCAPTILAESSSCIDTSRKCARLNAASRCSSSAKFRLKCPVTSGSCGACEDLKSKCSLWPTSRLSRKCAKNRIRDRKCRRTCGTCSSEQQTVKVDLTVSGDECSDALVSTIRSSVASGAGVPLSAVAATCAAGSLVVSTSISVTSASEAASINTQLSTALATPSAATAFLASNGGGGIQ
eukprot:437280-Prymnesium_polylepis.1